MLNESYLTWHIRYDLHEGADFCPIAHQCPRRMSMIWKLETCQRKLRRNHKIKIHRGDSRENYQRLVWLLANSGSVLTNQKTIFLTSIQSGAHAFISCFGCRARISQRVTICCSRTNHLSREYAVKTKVL